MLACFVAGHMMSTSLGSEAGKNGASGMAAIEPLTLPCTNPISIFRCTYKKPGVHTHDVDCYKPI